MPWWVRHSQPAPLRKRMDPEGLHTVWREGASDACRRWGLTIASRRKGCITSKVELVPLSLWHARAVHMCAHTDSILASPAETVVPVDGGRA